MTVDLSDQINKDLQLANLAVFSSSLKIENKPPLPLFDDLKIA